MRIKTRFSCRLGAPLAIAGCPGVPGTAAMDLKRLYYRPIGGALPIAWCLACTAGEVVLLPIMTRVDS